MCTCMSKGVSSDAGLGTCVLRRGGRWSPNASVSNTRWFFTLCNNATEVPGIRSNNVSAQGCQPEVWALHTSRTLNCWCWAVVKTCVHLIKSSMQWLVLLVSRGLYSQIHVAAQAGCTKSYFSRILVTLYIYLPNWLPTYVVLKWSFHTKPPDILAQYFETAKLWHFQELPKAELADFDEAPYTKVLVPTSAAKSHVTKLFMQHATCSE